jgi:hypothetical protein
MPDRDWAKVTLFEADCYCCVVRVEGYRDEEFGEPAWASVELLSPANERWRRKVSNRLRRAWWGIRAEPEEALTMVHADTVDQLISALIAARTKAWGERDAIR